MAIPLMLITLGVALARLSPGRLGLPVFLSVAKVAFCVAIAWGVGLWFGLPPMPVRRAGLASLDPGCRHQLPCWPRNTGRMPNAVAGVVVVSTLISVITLPLTLAFVI